MDEDDNDHEKTQIWLPGGALPPKPRNPSAVEHEMLLKPARKAAAETTAVDFDITTGTGAESPKAAPRQRTATGRTAAPAAPVRPTPEKSSTALVATIALILLVVVVGFVLTR